MQLLYLSKVFPLLHNLKLYYAFLGFFLVMITILETSIQASDNAAEKTTCFLNIPILKNKMNIIFKNTKKCKYFLCNMSLH